MDDTWAIRENLRRFRDMLKTEKDESKRRILEKLISDEEAKLPPGTSRASTRLDNARRWQMRAEEYRTVPDATRNPSARSTYLRLAQTYEAMANRADAAVELDTPPKVRSVLVRTWRLTSQQFADAAKGASDREMKRRLATQALDLAQQAEALERRADHSSSVPTLRMG